MSLDWDISAGRFTADPIRLTFADGSFFEIVQTLNGLDRTSLMGLLSDLSGLVLADATVRVRNNGVFDSMIAAQLAARFRDVEGDPDAVLNAALFELLDKVDRLPSEVLDGRSLQSIHQMFSDGPIPQGEVVVSLTGPGLPLDRFVGLGLSAGLPDAPGIRRAFQDQNLTVRYTAPDAR